MFKRKGNASNVSLIQVESTHDSSNKIDNVNLSKYPYSTLFSLVTRNESTENGTSLGRINEAKSIHYINTPNKISSILK